MYRLHDSEPPVDTPLHVSHRDTKHHLVSAASHCPAPETCKETPSLINRHCHQLTDMRPTHRTRDREAGRMGIEHEIEEGPAGRRPTRRPREAKLGVDWARPVAAP